MQSYASLHFHGKAYIEVHDYKGEALPRENTVRFILQLISNSNKCIKLAIFSNVKDYEILCNLYLCNRVLG